MKRVLCLSAVCFILILMLTSCSKDTKGEVDFGDYVLTTEDSESLAYNPSDVIEADSSWRSSYALSYDYYDLKSGESKIAEGKCGNYYQALDYATNIMTYITQENGYMMEYMLNGDTKTGTAAVVTDSDINDLYSGFVQMSDCDPYFSVYNNVTKVGTDFIANRTATRYKQVQEEKGKDKLIAYVWIDDQFGFASKCELYNAQTQELQMRWELLSFTQNVTEDGIKVNLDNYELSTEN